jgi:hypothetical protein
MRAVLFTDSRDKDKFEIVSADETQATQARFIALGDRLEDVIPQD